MKLGVIIILYHPELAHITALVDALCAAGVSVVLVDNSPKPLDVTLPGGCHYLHFPDNVGIAKAQNQGLLHLQERQFTHGILLDQDSQLDLNMIERLCGHFSALERRYDNVAALGPTIYCAFSDAPVKPVVQRPQPVSDNLVKIRQIIASGMMLSLSALKQIGLKEEALFIDGVDHEWCWRAQSKGFFIYQARDVEMPHRQGDARKKVLGITFKIGSPVRLYYQARNILLLVRRGYVPSYWKLRNLLALPIRFAVNRWLLPDGRKRGHYVWCGLKDGVAKKTGKMKE